MIRPRVSVLRSLRSPAPARPHRWRHALGAALLALAPGTAALAQNDAEQEMIVSHGYSFFGDLKYPEDYEHYDYVNPDAPKGGEIVLSVLGTFDSMNPYSRKGRGGALSTIMYESLLGDMPLDAYGENYGLLAERVEYPVGKDWVIFHMRPEARFSDGTPVTAHDVLFSHNLLLEQGLPSYAVAVKRLIPNAEVIDDHTIKFEFTPGVSRRSLIDQVGGVPVWSKAWFDETGARLDEPRLATSPGSGPYMIDSIDVNRRIVYKRNPDYWGWDLPINKGRHNYDRIRLEYFADDTPAFEAFKAGEVTFRSESDPKSWATQYNFPKVSNGQVVKEEIDDGTPPTPTGFVFNLGREVMKDKRVREALSLGYNFEWTNESLQYGLFSQRSSFTQNSPFEAKGAPEGAELALLESLDDLVPPAMLTEPARMPHESSATRLTDRGNLRTAMKLLDDAGWPVGSDGKRRNADGQLLQIKFLFNTASEGVLGGVVESYVKNLESMGITVNLDKVDPAQYTTRERDRDYDMVFDSYASFLEAGTGLIQRFGSAEAEFSLFNPAGLASPMVDAIIEAALNSTNSEEESAALMALDRALRYEFFMIPVWYKDKSWVAYYDMYEHPADMPPLDVGFLDFWWVNEDKAAALRSSGAVR
ncbi:extracellular solute-binding protein [Chachezhania antarctica]|uniref:extracellular solute-binding protein n=1 Tax=Chachezhania antarctica TaxID=2340860 RepID=UPI000EAC0CD8|nr:extracellular solute-binding protein [Chachezhania antarctica]|tara:strand:- start:6208 stop:8142 length:1935 start_codon:yes stop_codon:yes gene_type:complete